MMAWQGSATKPFSERLKELKSGRCHVGAAVAEEILRNSVGDIPSLLRDGYTVILYYIIYIYTSEGTKFMLLGSFAKHPFRSTADHIFKSVLCGRCGPVNYHPSLNIYKSLKLLEGGNATGYDKAPC